MEKSDRKVGKVFLIFAGICIVALPLIVFSAFSSEPQEIQMTATVTETRNMDFDNNGKAIFVNYDQISEDYLKGTSTGRTLNEYYSRRQYPGSPPFIPHKVEEPDLARVECLACHLRGGWSEELKKNTPITPHPEQEACRQCHITATDAELFVETDWKSVAPPRLGRAALPGAPLPIPHEIQMRGNCIACHVGPGTIATIRVEHPSRGNCRQCHVPQNNVPPWQRQSKSG
jgi:cytochrome c-type protein NapB